MIRICKASIGAAVLLAVTGTNAQASSCWSGVEQAAAKVRNLQLRLVDATLKCQMAGIDITPSYNEFVRANRATLQGANDVLRARLGEAEYDRFVTSLANGTAGGGTDAASCAQAAATADQGRGAAGEVQALVTVEEGLGNSPALPGGSCPITFTMAAAVTATATAQ